jgi:hypothetical protein
MECKAYQREWLKLSIAFNVGQTFISNDVSKYQTLGNNRTKLIINPCNANDKIEFRFHNLIIRES